jgi:hypothetical protein
MDSSLIGALLSYMYTGVAMGRYLSTSVQRLSNALTRLIKHRLVYSTANTMNTIIRMNVRACSLKSFEHSLYTGRNVLVATEVKSINPNPKSIQRKTPLFLFIVFILNTTFFVFFLSFNSVLTPYKCFDKVWVYDE